jgi:N-hydroxyarylamine O-acetyltransferase
VDVAAYLSRIRYTGTREPSLETLRALHASHLMTVPFEDLDVYLGRPVDLAGDALFEKIVRGRRGGFCYELNGAFALLLRALGFNVTLLNARVSRKGQGFGPPFDHLALLIELERPWLADVGYPRSPREPLLLDTEFAQESDGTSFRISRHQGSLCLFQQTPDGWSPEYCFDLEPRHIEDFFEMCRFHETSAESPFYGWLGCTISTDDGRVTLSDDKLIVRSKGVREETGILRENVGDILRERFGIAIDHDWR